MNLEYNLEKLEEDLKNFVAAGAYAFCKESPFKKQVDEYLEPDKVNLRELMNENSWKGAVLDFSEIVNRQESTPEATSGIF